MPVTHGVTGSSPVRTATIFRIPWKSITFKGFSFLGGAQSGDQSNNKILNGFKDIYWKLIQEHPELTARQVWITTIRTLQTRLPFSKRTYWCGSWIKLSMGNGAESSMKCALLPRKFAKRVFILQVAWQVFHYLFVMNWRMFQGYFSQVSFHSPEIWKSFGWERKIIRLRTFHRFPEWQNTERCLKHPSSCKVLYSSCLLYTSDAADE